MTRIMEKSNLTIIIPVHIVDQDVKDSFAKALDSASGLKVLVVTPNVNTEKEVRALAKQDNVTYVSSNGDSDFASLVNFGVSQIETEWFSILEFDDTLTGIFEKHALSYIENKPDVSMFIPFEDIYDYKSNKIIGSANEAPWASSFSNEIGFLDFDALQSYYDFYLTGSIFNKSDWEEVGGLKNNIKLTFWYEFMLRLTNKGKKIFVIPKVLYNHYLNRDNSLINECVKNVDEAESKFWFDTAKKEYFYTTAREVQYTPAKD